MSSGTKDQNLIPPVIPGFRFVEIAGRGGMSVVWKAYNAISRKHVAVKVMNREFSMKPSDIKQFQKEALAMSVIRHPCLVHAKESSFSKGRYYFVMDYVGGYTFGERLRKKGHVPEDEVITIAESVSVALDYAWSNYKVTHCDIKPENIMVDVDGTVKVMDLGLCQFSHTGVKRFHDSGDDDDEVVGTPAYISPEQIWGDVELDCRADIYSLGATMYHLATGRMLYPFKSNDDILRAHVDPEQTAPDPRTIVPEISEGFVRMLRKMLALDRDCRYDDWEAVIDDFRRLERGGMPDDLDASVATAIARA